MCVLDDSFIAHLPILIIVLPNSSSQAGSYEDFLPFLCSDCWHFSALFSNEISRAYVPNRDTGVNANISSREHYNRICGAS